MMEKSEVIAKAIEVAENNTIAKLIEQGVSEEVAKAHMVIGRDQTVSLLSESYDLFVTVGAISI